MKKLVVLSVFLSLFVLVFGGCGDSGGRVGFNLPQVDVVFPNATVGYSARPPWQVQVTNIGDSAISVSIALSDGDVGGFDLSHDALDIPARASRGFSVVPARGLPAGLHEATVTVGAEGVPSRSFNARFTVVTEAVQERHVFLAFGQSNMQGPGPIRPQDRENVSARWQVMNVVAGTYDGMPRARGQWYTAIPPLVTSGSLNHWQHPFTTGLGPLDYFGRTLVANTPEHVTIRVIPVAHGDLALGAFHRTLAATYFAPGSGGAGREEGRPSVTERQGWDRYTGAGYASLFDAIVSNARIAQLQLGMIKGIIVHQGESGRGLTYASWPEMLRDIYDDMLEALNLAPNSIPILLGQTWDAGSGQTGGMLNDDNRIQSYIPNAWVISSESLTTGRPVNDFLHFGSEDLEVFGARYAEKMLDLIYR